MTGHEQYWEEQAAGYALDALEPDEAAEFLRHLADCADCRARVDQHALVAAQLGALAYDDRPAPTWSALRDGIVEAADESPNNVVPIRRRRVAALVSAAAAAVAAVVGVTVWQTTGGSSHGPLTSAAACTKTLGCHVVALMPGGSRNVAASVLVYGHDVAVVSNTMSRPPAGSEWVLWRLSAAGPPQLVTTFDQANSERVSLRVSYADITGFAVSREPAGSTPTKPSTVVATGTVA